MELDELLEAKSRELKDLQDKKIISLNDEIRYILAAPTCNTSRAS